MAGSSYQHSLEARASKLAAALNQRVDAFASALTPPGSRPPFTHSFSRTGALDTILKNWNHPATQQWIGAMDPLAQLQLHNALGEHIRQSGMMPDPASRMAANPLGASSYRVGMNVS